MTWDSKDNIFIADGYSNSRVVKMAKDGTWVKAVGTRGAGPNQFNTVHGIASDAKNNIYVADRGNRRIQVYDADLNFVKIDHDRRRAVERLHVTPRRRSICSAATATARSTSWIMNGNLVGWAQTSMGHGQTGCLIHELHCESENVIYKGDCSTWTVEKITIKGGGKTAATSTR